MIQSGSKQKGLNILQSDDPELSREGDSVQKSIRLMRKASEWGFAFMANLFQLLQEAHHEKHLLRTLKGLYFELTHHFRTVLKDINQHVVTHLKSEGIEGVARQRLQARCLGLHSLLPGNDRFYYSILIPVYHPHPVFFEKAVQAALNQSAPYGEVLLGLDGPQSEAVMATLAKLKANHQGSRIQLRIIELDRSKTGGGISHTTNALAQAARGNFLLLMDHDDWISPELLFRYEQCLRLHSHPTQMVLYCDEFKIDEYDTRIRGSDLRKPDHPSFPYFFINTICHCLLVPKNLWDQVGGLRPECDGAQDFDIALRLDLAGALFQNIPISLYAWRSHALSTAQNLNQKDYATPAGIRALKDYCAAKKLDWEIVEGKIKTTYRAIPRQVKKHIIQVVMPFRDQKEMTLKAVASLFHQKNVEIRLTAVDNGSTDVTIEAELIELGAGAGIEVEVLRVDEPFNFSRLNNLGVKRSRFSSEVDSLLFLNNDVELDPDAVEEMSRWLDQPQVGMIGAKLSYPNGNLQHGGVTVNPFSSGHVVKWTHVNANDPPDRLGFANVLGVCDAVTGACLLIKKEHFLQVGGFDEIWYPIAFSDTDLATKLRRLGLYSLYTPYASGVHYESVSRGKGDHEEFESTYWLFRNTEHREIPQKKLKNYLFLTDC